MPPTAVVLAATGTGLTAALTLANGDFVTAALLVQLKTLLDNADGQLARQTGGTTVLGRYLDAESDLLVDASLLLALGWVTGAHLSAAVAFALLTLVLAVNFNVERLYRQERGEATDRQPPATGIVRVFERAYAALYGPLDQLVEGFTEWRLARRNATTADRLAYHDAWTVGVVANLGLTTQMTVLGGFLLLGRPGAFLWWVFGCAGAVAMLLALREARLPHRPGLRGGE